MWAKFRCFLGKLLFAKTCSAKPSIFQCSQQWHLRGCLRPADLKPQTTKTLYPIGDRLHKSLPEHHLLRHSLLLIEVQELPVHLATSISSYFEEQRDYNHQDIEKSNDNSRWETAPQFHPSSAWMPSDSPSFPWSLFKHQAEPQLIQKTWLSLFFAPFFEVYKRILLPGHGWKKIENVCRSLEEGFLRHVSLPASESQTFHRQWNDLILEFACLAHTSLASFGYLDSADSGFVSMQNVLRARQAVTFWTLYWCRSSELSNQGCGSLILSKLKRKPCTCHLHKESILARVLSRRFSMHQPLEPDNSPAATLLQKFHQPWWRLRRASVSSQRSGPHPAKKSIGKLTTRDFWESGWVLSFYKEDGVGPPCYTFQSVMVCIFIKNFIGIPGLHALSSRLLIYFNSPLLWSPSLMEQHIWKWTKSLVQSSENPKRCKLRILRVLFWQNLKVIGFSNLRICSNMQLPTEVINFKNIPSVQGCFVRFPVFLRTFATSGMFLIVEPMWPIL